jgi:hypothetical protein
MVAALALAAASSCSPEPVSCAMCGRHDCGNMTFTLVREGGTEVPTCCARCGAHTISQAELKIVDLRVRDFETAGEIDAASAVYVEGSDVHPCRGIDAGPVRDPHGRCAIPSFDRCEPSVLAFRDEPAARRFIALHGGTLTTWQRIAPSPG